MQRTAVPSQRFEHKLQCDAHSSKIEFYCSEVNCEQRFLCFRCISLPGYHQHDNRNVDSINRLLSNTVDDSALTNQSNFLEKCVEFRNIVNSMPETVSCVLELSKKLLAKLKTYKQVEHEDNSSDSRKQKLKTLNDDIIQQIKDHTQGQNLSNIKSMVKESLSLRKELQSDSLWSLAANTQEGYTTVNHFMSVSHQRLRALVENLQGFLVLLDRPAQNPLTKEASDKSVNMIEESKTNGKAASNEGKNKTPKITQSESEGQNKQDNVIKEDQRKAIMEKISVILQNDSKITFKELEQMVAVAGNSYPSLKQIYDKAIFLLKNFEKIVKKPETLKKTVRDTLSHFTPSIESSIQISLLNTIDYAFEGLEKLVTEKISGKPDIGSLKQLFGEMKSSRVDFSKQLEILLKGIDDCETIRTKLLTVLDQAKKGKENIKISVFTELMLESLDLLAKPSESNNSLTIFFETLCVKCKLGFFRKAIADHTASLSIQGKGRRNPFVKSFSADEVNGVLKIVDKMWFFDFEEEEEMTFQTLKKCKQIEMQLSTELKQNKFENAQQIQPLVQLCDQAPFSFPQIFAVMERVNTRMFLTNQDIEVKQEAEGQMNEEVPSDPLKVSYNRRQSMIGDSDLMASLSRSSKEPSGANLDISAQVNIKVEEAETEKNPQRQAGKQKSFDEPQKSEPDKLKTKQSDLTAPDISTRQNLSFVSTLASPRGDSSDLLYRQSFTETKGELMQNSEMNSKQKNDDDDDIEDQPRKVVKVSKTETIAVKKGQTPTTKDTKEKKSKKVTQISREESKSKLIKAFNLNPVFSQLSEEEIKKYGKSIELSIFDKYYLHNDAYSEKVTKISEILENLKKYKFLSQLIVKSSFNFEKLEHLQQLKEEDYNIFEEEAQKLLNSSRNEIHIEQPQSIKKIITAPKFQLSNGQSENHSIAHDRQSSFKFKPTPNSAFSDNKLNQINQKSQFKRRTQSELVPNELRIEEVDLQQDPKSLLNKLQLMGVDKVQHFASTLPENERLLIFLTLSSMANNEHGNKTTSNDSVTENTESPNKKQF